MSGLYPNSRPVSSPIRQKSSDPWWFYSGFLASGFHAGNFWEFSFGFPAFPNDGDFWRLTMVCIPRSSFCLPATFVTALAGAALLVQGSPAAQQVTVQDSSFRPVV